jgi:hypothetical protein
MQVGDYIRVKGKRSDWLDARGVTHPDWHGIIIEMKPRGNLFLCTAMKPDGSLWDIRESQCKLAM